MSFDEVLAFVDSVDSKGFIAAGYHYLDFQNWPVRLAPGLHGAACFVALSDELFLIHNIHKKGLSVILHIESSPTTTDTEIAINIKTEFALGIDVIVLNNSKKTSSESWYQGISELIKMNQGNDEASGTRKKLLYYSSNQIALDSVVDPVGSNSVSNVNSKQKQGEWASVVKVFNHYFLNEQIVENFPYQKSIQLSYSNNYSKKNGELGVEEAKSQISLWCIADFPLQISNDVRYLNDIGTRVLANREILALHANAAGRFSKCVYNQNNMQVYVKQTSQRKDEGLVILILNLDTIANKFILPAELFNFSSKFLLRDLWDHQNLGYFDAYIAVLPPHGCKVFRAVEN